MCVHTHAGMHLRTSFMTQFRRHRKEMSLRQRNVLIHQNEFPASTLDPKHSLQSDAGASSPTLMTPKHGGFSGSTSSVPVRIHVLVCLPVLPDGLANANSLTKPSTAVTGPSTRHPWPVPTSTRTSPRHLILLVPAAGKAPPSTPTAAVVLRGTSSLSRLRVE